MKRFVIWRNLSREGILSRGSCSVLGWGIACPNVFHHFSRSLHRACVRVCEPNKSKVLQPSQDEFVTEFMGCQIPSLSGNARRAAVRPRLGHLRKHQRHALVIFEPRHPQPASNLWTRSRILSKRSRRLLGCKSPRSEA